MLDGSTLCFNYNGYDNDFEKAFSDSSTLYRDLINQNESKADLVK